MSTAAAKIALLQAYRTSWAENYEEQQKELFAIAARVIAGNYA
jgi:ribose/xylose/arabinose/galactoside ABC-type transport system permease subunit